MDINEDEKQQAIKEYLQRKNTPEQEFDTEAASSREDSNRADLEKRAAYEPSMLAKAVTGMAAGFGGRSGSEAVQGLYKDQRAARDEISRIDREAPEKEWARKSRARQEQDWSRADTDRSSDNDPNSEQSRMAQSLASKMMPGKDFSTIPASKLKTLIPTIEKIYATDAIRINAAEKAKAASVPKPTEGQKTVDRSFGKDYNDWTSGGNEVARSEIQKLKGLLEPGAIDTGGLTGMFPDRITSSDVLKARADVHSSILQSLRAILGAQFTEKEGDRILKATWNEADTPENNKARIERLVKDLESKADAKDAKAQYFRDNGSLTGYSPGSVQAAPSDTSTEDQAAVEWARANPDDPRAKAIIDTIKSKGL